jgi:hypothetical protein
MKETVMARVFWKALFCASLAVALPLCAQEAKVSAKEDSSATKDEKPPAKEISPAKSRRLSYGFRVEAFPLPLFKTSTATSSTTNPIADYTFTASTNSPKAAPAASVAFRLMTHLTLVGEFYLQHAKYTQTSTERTGKLDPNASTDTRPVTTIIQSTEANYWVFPVMARWDKIPGFLPRAIPGRRLRSHAYVAGGVEFRHVGRIRTGNDITNPDLTTNYNETPAPVNLTNQFGGLVALGLRFKDDFGIKVTPELRFIRWKGYTLQGPGYQSQPYQAEVGLGISF